MARIIATYKGKTYTIRISHPVSGNPTYVEYEIETWGYAPGDPLPHSRISSRTLLDITSDRIFLKIHPPFDGKAYREICLASEAPATRLEPIENAEVEYS